MRRLKEWTRSVPGVISVAAVLATGAVVAAGSAGAGESQETEAGAPTVAAVSPEQAARVGELRRAARADDRLPDRWSQAIAGAARHGRSWGANPELARRSAPGVWIVPADGHICVVSNSPTDGSAGFGCASDADLARGRLAPTEVDANGTGVVTGIVPDGVASVELVDRDGSTRRAEVEHNTYRAAVDARLKEVRFADAEGVRHVLPMEWKR